MWAYLLVWWSQQHQRRLIWGRKKSAYHQMWWFLASEIRLVMIKLVAWYNVDSCSSTCITICRSSTKSKCPLKWPKWLIPDYYTEVTEEKETGKFPWHRHQPAVVRTSTTDPRMAVESGILTAPRTVSTTSPPKPLDSCWISLETFQFQYFRQGTVSIHYWTYPCNLIAVETVTTLSWPWYASCHRRYR